MDLSFERDPKPKRRISLLRLNPSLRDTPRACPYDSDPRPYEGLAAPEARPFVRARGRALTRGV